jgi:hypothetical protein
MKKTLILTMMMISIFTLVGCDQAVTYDVQTKFLYSEDGTSGTYVEGVQEFYVGTRIYLTIEIKYSAKSRDDLPIEFEIKIPYAEHYDAFYFDGQKLDPIYDSVLKILTYKPTLVFSSDPKITILVFQIKPTEEGIARITVEYPDIIGSNMDAQDTVQFITT